MKHVRYLSLSHVTNYRLHDAHARNVTVQCTLCMPGVPLHMVSGVIGGVPYFDFSVITVRLEREIGLLGVVSLQCHCVN
jgi:hypothetical protein